MKKNIKNRIDDLENHAGDRPFIAIFQDWDDPDLWHPGCHDAEPISWDQVGDQYKDHEIIQVFYTDNWRQDD